MRVTSRSTASTTESSAARGSPSRRHQLGVDEREHRGGLAGEVGADQVVLALEEPVDRHLAQAGLADQLVHPDAARAPAGEEPFGGVEHDGLPLGAAAANRARAVFGQGVVGGDLQGGGHAAMVHHSRDGAVRGTPRDVALCDEGPPGFPGPRGGVVPVWQRRVTITPASAAPGSGVSCGGSGGGWPACGRRSRRSPRWRGTPRSARRRSRRIRARRAGCSPCRPACPCAPPQKQP